MDRTGSERGATLIEYALLVALIAVVVAPTARLLTDRSLAKLQGVGERIGSATAPPPEATTPGSGGGPGGGNGGPGGPGGPTTTPPGTTTPPTSTTQPSRTAAASLGQPSSWAVGWTNWSGSARVTVTGAGGAPVAGATVQVRIHGSDIETATVTVTTASDGTATIEVGPYGLWLWNVVDRVQVTVIAVDAAGDLTWDGSGATTTISAPR